MMTRRMRPLRAVSSMMGRKGAEEDGAARISGREDEIKALSTRYVLRYCQAFGLLR